MCVLTAMGIGCVLPASAQITTTTSLKASPAAAKLGQVVTLQASVSPYPNAGIADRVTFYDGVSILGSAGVSKQGGQGVALFDALLPAGNHMLYAYYSGRPTVLTPSKSVNKVTVQVSAVPSAMYRAFDAGPSEKNKMQVRGAPIRISSRSDKSDDVPAFNSHSLAQPLRIAIQVRVVITILFFFVEQVYRAAARFAEKQFLDGSGYHRSNGRPSRLHDVDRFMANAAVKFFKHIPEI